MIMNDTVEPELAFTSTVFFRYNSNSVRIDEYFQFIPPLNRIISRKLAERYATLTWSVMNFVRYLREIKLTLVRQQHFGCQILVHVIEHYDLYPYNFAAYNRIRQIHGYEERSEHFQLKKKPQITIIAFLLEFFLLLQQIYGEQ